MWIPSNQYVADSRTTQEESEYEEFFDVEKGLQSRVKSKVIPILLDWNDVC